MRPIGDAALIEDAARAVSVDFGSDGVCIEDADSAESMDSESEDAIQYEMEILLDEHLVEMV